MSAGKVPINEMKPNKPIITCFVMALKKKTWFSDITTTKNYDIYFWCLPNINLTISGQNWKS